MLKLWLSWASADFFPGEGKIFQGGAKTYHLPKKHLKTYYFLLKKSKNILFWLARGGQGPPLALPCGRPCIILLLILFGKIRAFWMKIVK